VLQSLLPRVAPARQVQSLAILLLERGRIALLPALARAYEEMCDEKLGRVRAVVKSATALDLGSETEIRKAIERRTGKKVLMTTVVDPNLLGGVVAHVAGLVLDGSVATRLSNLKNRLLN
jgi:F-type H+-transporting ATPase subunit delta